MTMNHYNNIYFEGVEDVFAWNEKQRRWDGGSTVDEKNGRMLEMIIQN